MPKVVGEDPQARKQCTCRGCGALVEYVLNDVQEYRGRDYGGGPDGRRWVVCPRCGKGITLESW